MKRVEPFASLLLPGSSASSGFRVLILALMLVLFLTPTRAQNSQFQFDVNGNLTLQAAATSALPLILGQPQNQVVEPGDAASFLVVVADTRGLSYQWRFNGADIFGANGDALLLQNVGTNDVGQYSVVLINGSGSVTSTPAALMLDSRDSGMPDSWQLAYFGNLTNNATGDYDHDGVSNLQEFLDGTDPTDSASARFRLRVLNNGGAVDANPLRLSYTNGEQVTLAATAFPPFSFRGWAGDINSTNNPVTLTMTNNKTVFAYLGAMDLSWTNNVSGDWNVATNWNPNVVPGAYDHATIARSVIVTLSTDTECGSLTLGSTTTFPTLTGSGTFTLYGSSTWIGGTISGIGRIVNRPGATLTVANSGTVGLYDRQLENGGTVFWPGPNNISLGNTVITNLAGAVFLAQNDASLTGSGSRFDNAGSFRKSVSMGTMTVGIAFNNYGTVDIQAGTLLCGGNFLNDGLVTLSAATTNRLARGGSASGTFTAPASALVEWAGSTFFALFTLNPGTQLNGDGLYRINGDTVTFNTDVALQNLSLVTTLNGTGNVTINNTMDWTGGTMSGSGRTVILPGATLNIASAFSLALNGRALENGGIVRWTDASVYLTSTVITNRAGALFDAQNDASFSYQGGTVRFDNAGTFRKSVSIGTTTVGGSVAFNNYGTVDLRSGILAANGGYASSPGALLSCALGGTTPGTGHGQLQVAGTVTLSGALSVDLINGFIPSVGDSFTILTAGTRGGTFANFSYPSNAVTMQLSNTANSVIARVTDVLVVPQPILLQPQLAGSNITLIWTARSNTTYQLEFNPDLIPSKWNALPGDVIGASNTASKLDVLTSSNRFYRVRVLP